MNYKKNILILCSLFFIGCSSLNIPKSESTKKEIKETKKTEETKKTLEVYDPLEPFNRRMYYFNYQLDKYVLIPAVNTYEFIMPEIAQKGVSNFFSNLGNINTFINSLLQFELKKAGATFTRFGVNSTVGILGLFDVASKLGVAKPYEDFGLTLAKYGVGSGPYIVLPALGPTNLRDSVGQLVDTASVSAIDPFNSKFGISKNNPEIIALDSIETRQQKKSFRYYGTSSPFEYEYVRYIYQKYRETLKEINKDL